METKLDLKDKRVRLSEALRMIEELNSRGIVVYGIWKKTGITNNTMRYWKQGIWFPSAKVLKRLTKFYQGVIRGKVKVQSK